MDPNPSHEKDQGVSLTQKEKHSESKESQKAGAAEQPGQTSSIPNTASRASTLSADAPPFQFSSSQASSTQLSAAAKEFIPRSVATPAYVEPYAEETSAEYNPDQFVEEDKGDPLMEYALQVLYEITCNPGHFTHLCEQLVATLTSWPSLDETLLLVLVDEIVAQAIREPNFRYNGARLCNSISRALGGPGFPDFRGILFTRCKMIHDERKTLMQSDAEYLRGFALFMSELFVHMTSKDNANRYRVLGRGVRELLVTLLDHPTPGNVKCVCQILKLSGSYLEDNDREMHRGKPVDMDQLMAKIDNVARTVNMQMHMKDQLANMIELRASDWGRAQSNVPAARETQPPNHTVPPPQMGVHYGPDGMALTAEEAEFLNQSLNKHEEEEEYDFQEEDAGMDDEMAEAFEKFLMMKEALK